MTSRFIFSALAALLLLACLMLMGVAIGTVNIPLHQAIAVLSGNPADVPEMVQRIVLDLRLPRSLLAALTGAGLAMVGALLQTATRNELADPFLFGLSSGASAGAVTVITRFGDKLGDWSLPVAAFMGGILSAISVIMLFILQKTKGAERLVICGLAISFLFGAITHYMVFSGDQRAANAILFWSLGGLGMARWGTIGFALLSVALLVMLLIWRWRDMDALLAGEQVAHSLGIAVARLRLEIFIVCALTTSLLVALTGVIGFVGLMVPHLVRPLCNASHRMVIPLTGLAGAVLMTSGDLLSRTLIAPQELPIGIITAGLGGLFVLGLVLKQSRRQ